MIFSFYDPDISLNLFLFCAITSLEDYETNSNNKFILKQIFKIRQMRLLSFGEESNTVGKEIGDNGAERKKPNKDSIEISSSSMAESIYCPNADSVCLYKLWERRLRYTAVVDLVLNKTYYPTFVPKPSDCQDQIDQKTYV